MRAIPSAEPKGKWKGDDDGLIIPVNCYSDARNLIVKMSSSSGRKVQIEDGATFYVPEGKMLCLVQIEGEVVAVFTATLEKLKELGLMEIFTEVTEQEEEFIRECVSGS